MRGPFHQQAFFGNFTDDGFAVNTHETPPAPFSFPVPSCYGAPNQGQTSSQQRNFNFGATETSKNDLSPDMSPEELRAREYTEAARISSASQFREAQPNKEKVKTAMNRAIGVADEVISSVITGFATAAVAAASTAAAGLSENTTTSLHNPQGEVLNAQVLDDVTFPVGSTVPGGASFVKTWTVKNTGTSSTWANVELQLSGQDYFFSNSGKSLGDLSVPPNSSVDISISLIAPNVPGRYVEYFSLHNSSGERFGDYLCVDVNVREDDFGWDVVHSDSPSLSPVQPIDGDVAAAVAAVDPSASASVPAVTTAANNDTSPEQLWSIELSILREMGFSDSRLILSVLKDIVGEPIIRNPDQLVAHEEELIQRVVVELVNRVSH